MLVSTVLLLIALAYSTDGGGSLGPAFSGGQRTVVVARTGGSVELLCHVLRLADRAVSWVRSSDLQILTHAGVVFTADSRVSSDALALAEPYATLHTLRIDALRVSDSGRYECQINTEPKLSLFFNLTVIEWDLPVVSVTASGGAVQRSKLGGAAVLSCEARYEPAAALAAMPAAALAALPPLALHWQHDGATLNPQSQRGGISLETERWETRMVSRLTLASLGTRDAGRYVCAATDASATLMLRLYRFESDDQEDDIIDAEMEMQRDQPELRVSAANSRVARPALFALTVLMFNT